MKILSCKISCHTVHRAIFTNQGTITRCVQLDSHRPSSFGVIALSMLGSEISLLKTLPLTSDAYACGTWTIE